MGIVIKESINQSVVRVGLSVLGGLATIFVYSLDTNLYGIFGFVIDTSTLLMPFVLVGLGHGSIKFFPFFNESVASRRKYFYFLFRLFIINAILTTGLFLLSKSFLVKYASNKSADFELVVLYIIPGCIIFAANQFLLQYISNYKKVTLPVVLQNVYKILTPVMFLFAYLKITDVLTAVQFLLGCMAVGMLFFLYLTSQQFAKTGIRVLKSPPSSFSKSNFYKYYFWTFASSAGAMILLKVDSFMISTIMNFSATGEYRIAAFMAAVVAIPIHSVVTITSPIISQAWADKNHDELERVYLRGSRNLLFVGGGLLLLILTGVQLLPQILPQWTELNQIKWIVIILGSAKLFDMFSGVNGAIIQQSEWFRYNTLFILTITIVNIVLNYFLINEYDIYGAAVATGLSLILFNILKCILLYNKIDLHPFKLGSILYFLGVVGLLLFNIFLNDWISGIAAFVISLLLNIVYLLLCLFVINFAPETKKTLLNILKRLS